MSDPQDDASTGSEEPAHNSRIRVAAVVVLAVVVAAAVGSVFVALLGYPERAAQAGVSGAVTGAITVLILQRMPRRNRRR